MSSRSSGSDSPKEGGSSGSASLLNAPSSDPSGPTVLVVGGGLAALCTAASLAAIGADVHVYEAAGGVPPHVDPGFALTEELQAFCTRHGLSVGAVSSCGRQVLLDGDGEPLQDARQQAYTSWEALRSALLAKLPAGNYHPGCRVAAVDLSDPGAAIIELESGERIAGNLIVAADGINSSVREQLLPDCQPTYAGYLAWRGVARLNALPGAVQHLLADKHTLYKGSYLHVHVYPLPDSSSRPSSSAATAPATGLRANRSSGGLRGSCAGGGASSKDIKALLGGGSEHERVGWTWFNNQVEDELSGLLLDHEAAQQRHAVPLAHLNPAVADAVVQAAADALPAPIAQLVAASTSCMGVTAVSDLVLSGCVIANKLVLVGQAGAVIRPHNSSTAQQAVHDANSLAGALKLHGFALDKALPRWEALQVQHNLAQCRAAVTAGERMQGYTA